jgi:hypothetical protein
MTKIEQIQIAISNADRMQSGLSKECFDVPMLGSLKIRHLLNNLGAISTEYLECGSHRGGSFCSTVNNNNLVIATAVDSYLETFHKGDSLKDFMDNAEKFCPEHTLWDLLKEDYFKVYIAGKPDLFLFDGFHSEEHQAKALTYFAPMLADEFIYVCDDYMLPQVKAGTQRGIKEAGLKILFEQELENPSEVLHQNDFWWSGVYIALLKK